MSTGNKSKTRSSVTTISFHIYLQGLRKVWREIALVHVSRASNGGTVYKGWTYQARRRECASSLTSVKLGEHLWTIADNIQVPVSDATSLCTCGILQCASSTPPGPIKTGSCS
jgi:hypothetical protein